MSTIEIEIELVGLSARQLIRNYFYDAKGNELMAYREMPLPQGQTRYAKRNIWGCDAGRDAGMKETSRLPDRPWTSSHPETSSA